MNTLFSVQEKFPFVEEKLKTPKGTEELGFQAVVKLLLSSVCKFVSSCVL